MKKRILIIGAGAQGNVVSGVLSKAEDVGRLTLGDIDRGITNSDDIALVDLGDVLEFDHADPVEKRVARPAEAISATGRNCGTRVATEPGITAIRPGRVSIGARTP